MKKANKKEYKPKQQTSPSEYEHKESEPEYWAEKYLGNMGKMISGSKSIYLYDNPKNLVGFNSNVLTKEDGKIWHGDLDLTESHKELKALSKKLKKEVYVLYESDARFANEKNPKFDNAIAVFNGTKISFTNNKSKYFYQEKGIPYVKTKKDIEKETEQDEEYKEPKYSYKRSEYTSKIKLPDLSKYKLSVKNSPIDFYQEGLIEILGKKKAQDIYLDIYVTKKYYDQFESLLTKFVKRKFKYLHPVKISQTISFTMLDLAPSHFLTDQPWASDDLTGYVRKKD